jgi:TatD DNase family protein
MPDYFDIHSHLNFTDYADDFEAVIGRLRETKTHTITVGTDIELSRIAVALADTHEEIYACIGVHPVDNPSRVFDKNEFATLAVHPKVVAIGECGLDYFRLEGEAKEQKNRQRDLFEAQIKFALEHDKALMLHCRSAYDDSLDILESYKKEYGDRLRGNAHFFAGGLDIAKRLFDINFSVSFTGVITFARDYDEVIQFAPLSMLMAETDAPYVTPVPYRGKRNEPAYVSEVVKKIAEIRGEDFDVIKKAMVQNAFRVFNIAS